MSRLIVVTGVSRGLGAAMVDGFVAAGHQVVGCARSQDAVATLTTKYPDPHRFDAVDVADDEETRAWATSVLESQGTPDLIVNNAALINQSQELWKVPAEEFSDVVDVNVKGVFHIIRHFLPAMLTSGRGVIANFSSGWGRSTSPEVAPYCATKWAVEGLSLALAQELPRGVAAVSVNPGIINTDMLKSCFGESASGFPTAQEWAKKAVPFLLALGPSDNGKQLSV